jgi:hypothetical protein
MSQKPTVRKYRRFGQRVQAIEEALKRGDAEKAVAIYNADPKSQSQPATTKKYSPRQQSKWFGRKKRR